MSLPSPSIVRKEASFPGSLGGDLVYSFPAMNKKVVLGCLGAAAVVLIAGGVAGYFFLVRPGMEYVRSIGDVAKVSEMDSQVQNTQSFTPPQDGLLTEDQVTRFVQVQRTITSRLGEELQNLKQKHSSMSGEGGNPSLTEFISIWHDLSGTVLKAKEIQVQALNDSDFSLEEYRWVRSSFYKALGASFVSLNLEQAAAAIKQQNPELLEQNQAEADQLAPEQNRELAAPYADESKNWIAYAWLGL